MTCRDLLAWLIVIAWLISNIIMACISDIYFIINNCLWYGVLMAINLAGLLNNKIDRFLNKPILKE